MINRSVIRKNWLASSHILKTGGRSFGRKKYYGLTVTVSSEGWWAPECNCTVFFRVVLSIFYLEKNQNKQCARECWWQRSMNLEGKGKLPLCIFFAAVQYVLQLCHGEQRNHCLKYESDCVRIGIGIKIFMNRGRFCERSSRRVFVIHTAIERKHSFCFRTNMALHGFHVTMT